MAIVIIALSAVAGFALAAVTWLVLTRAWLWRRRARGVVVHTTDDRSMEGLLSEVARDGVVLKGARYLDDDKTVPMSGEIWVPRDKVAFIQVVR